MGSFGIKNLKILPTAKLNAEGVKKWKRETGYFVQETPTKHPKKRIQGNLFASVGEGNAV